MWVYQCLIKLSLAWGPTQYCTGDFTMFRVPWILTQMGHKHLKISGQIQYFCCCFSMGSQRVRHDWLTNTSHFPFCHVIYVDLRCSSTCAKDMASCIFLWYSEEQPTGGFCHLSWKTITIQIPINRNFSPQRTQLRDPTNICENSHVWLPFKCPTLVFD